MIAATTQENSPSSYMFTAQSTAGVCIYPPFSELTITEAIILTFKQHTYSSHNLHLDVIKVLIVQWWSWSALC